MQTVRCTVVAIALVVVMSCGGVNVTDDIEDVVPSSTTSALTNGWVQVGVEIFDLVFTCYAAGAGAGRRRKRVWRLQISAIAMQGGGSRFWRSFVQLRAGVAACTKHTTLGGCAPKERFVFRFRPEAWPGFRCGPFRCWQQPKCRLTTHRHFRNR